ncbi:hypothetical protein VB713_21105 [Anabaena cylindrica UHCC 0172]|nr:hypothetical protein [Anabaena cylindrica]MEA5553441.1 hypothetical protein [Anabaena cylindrica UHCC 0172]
MSLRLSHFLHPQSDVYDGLRLRTSPYNDTIAWLWVQPSDRAIIKTVKA